MQSLYPCRTEGLSPVWIGVGIKNPPGSGEHRRLVIMPGPLCLEGGTRVMTKAGNRAFSAADTIYRVTTKITVAGQRRTYTGFPHYAPRVRAVGAPSSVKDITYISTGVYACQLLYNVSNLFHNRNTSLCSTMSFCAEANADQTIDYQLKTTDYPYDCPCRHRPE